jgi:hypothetical protein
MVRFVTTGAAVSLLVLTFSNNAFARLILAGDKPRTTEIAELIDAYQKLVAMEEDKDLKAGVKAHIQKLIDDEKVREERVQSAVSWSNRSSDITFWIAHVLLAFGLLAAAMELSHSWRLRSKGKKETYEMEVGLEKIALKSSMYGFFILLVSLSFYFMYLRFVYPVTYIP